MLTDTIMDEVSTNQQREKASSPLNIEWGEDPFLDSKGRDVLDPVSFIDCNDDSLAADEPGVRSDMLDANEPMTFPESSRDFEMASADAPANEDTSMPESRRQIRKRKNSAKSSKQNSTTGTISRRKKKPKGMPKRPLSAYNLYFQSERAKIIAAQESGLRGKIGFEGLGKIIGKKWKELSAVERKLYEKLAEKDSVRYRKEMDTYNEMKTKKLDDEDKRSSQTFSELSSTLEQSETQVVRPYEAPTSFHEAPPKEDAYAVPMGRVVASPQPDNFSRMQPMQSNPPPQLMQQSYSFAQAEVSQAPAYPPQYDPGMRQSPMPGSGALPLTAQYVSLPPPPPSGTEQATPPGSFPMPPGMEIVLSDRSGNDRKYRVQYTCYSMTRDAAHQYIESVTGAAPNGQPPASSPAPYPASWSGF